MSKLTFRGGVHPYDGKDFSKSKPVQLIMPDEGEEMVFPLLQHIGAPAIPVVQKGDRVLVGQKIGEMSGFVSSNVISSISGEVTGIEPRLTVSGAKVDSIVIQNDGLYEKVKGFGQKRDVEKLSKEDIVNAVREAGIVGMGGAGFPTFIKLSPKNPEQIDTILVNAAECEPYLTSDYRMMIEYPGQIVEGLKIVLKLFNHARGIIVIEDNKMDAVQCLKEAVRDQKGKSDIEVKVLKTKYPQGAERQLIYASTGRRINSSMLPADAGCIVNNVDTVISIYRAVALNIPLIRRIVTITGDAVRKPCNFEVKTGMSFQRMLDKAGGFCCQPEKVISGGPMMGLALFSLDIPVSKTSSALLAFTGDEVSAYEPTACIHCGRCVKVCPSRLVPQKMLEYSNAFDEENFQKIHGMECYECGTCTYVCPAKRRMTQSFKQTRRSILEHRKKV